MSACGSLYLLPSAAGGSFSDDGCIRLSSRSVRDQFPYQGRSMGVRKIKENEDVSKSNKIETQDSTGREFTEY